MMATGKDSEHAIPALYGRDVRCTPHPRARSRGAERPSPWQYKADGPLLTVHEEISLTQRIRGGDERARERMIEANLRLVVSIAGTTTAAA